LRPAAPPTVAPARRSWRSWWPALLVAAAVLVAVVLLVRLPVGTPSRPLPDLPAATVPSVEPTPSSPGIDATAVPTPAATSPGVSPVPTASVTTVPPEPEISPPTGPAATPGLAR